MANINTALITPQFSLVRQTDINNNGEAIAYPQYTTVKYTAYFCDIKTKEEKTQNRSYRKLVENKFVEPNQIIGRLYFPKGHSQRSQSWFRKFVDVVYDSWKSNGAIGWTHPGNPVRVVRFVLKPGVDLALWLQIARDFTVSNLDTVRTVTDYILETISNKVASVVKSVSKTVRKKVTSVTSKVRKQHSNVRPQGRGSVCGSSTAQPASLETVSTPSNPQPTNTTKYSADSYAFVLKYKPRAIKRVCKNLKFKVVDNKTLVEDLISSQTPPEVVRGVFTKRKSSN